MHECVNGEWINKKIKSSVMIIITHWVKTTKQYYSMIWPNRTYLGKRPKGFRECQDTSNGCFSLKV